jgi:hypothetical protein
VSRAGHRGRGWTFAGTPSARAPLAVAGLVLLGVATLPVRAGALPALPARAAPATVSAVVVVGVPGLRWDDVTSGGTPTLWRLAGAGAVGSLSIRGGRPVTCPVDGWLTLAAGNRARGPAPVSGRCPVGTGLTPIGSADNGPVAIPGFARLARNNRQHSDGTEVGALAAAVRRGGGCVAALGSDPAAGSGAVLAAAGPDGRADVYTRGVAFTGTYTRCPVTLVELPAVPAAHRGADVAVVDADLAAVDGARPAGSELLVLGLAETTAQEARLHVAIAVGGGYPDGVLLSASTRRTPFVQLIDVAPTVLRDLGRPRPPVMAGQPWLTAIGGPRATATRVAALVDRDRAAVAQLRLTAPFFELLVAGQFVLYPLAAMAVRRRPAGPRRDRPLRGTELAGLAAAAVLVASYLANLVPWWRAGHPLPALLGALAVADAAVVALAAAGPWRRHPLGPAGAVAGLTAGALTVDLLTGARLQLASIAGYSPLVAGRFAGIGNIAFAVFATAALLLATVLAAGRSRRTAMAVVAAVGTTAVVVDGAPIFGSDVGGVLALVPAFALLGMLLAGVRVTARRVLAAAVAAVVAVTAFGLLDYARPADAQTHLGRFTGQLLHGGASSVVERKARDEVGTLTSSVLTLLVPLAVAILVGVLLRPPGWLRGAFARAPALQAGLVATLVMGIVAALVNDSGVIVPAAAMTVAIPLTIAVSAASSRAEAVTVEFRGRAGRPAQPTH